MKILHIYKDYFPVLGGIENYTRQLAEQMVTQGHEVEVLVTNSAHHTIRENRAGVKITKSSSLLTIASTPLSLRLPLEWYRHRYATNPPDIVHLQAPYPIGEAAWLLGEWLPSFGHKRPHALLTYHSDIIRQKRLLTVYSPFLRATLKRVDGIIATSPNYIESSPFLKPVATKCRVIPLGVDTKRFESFDPAAVNRIRERYATGQVKTLLLFTGRLRYYKGLQFLLEALPQVNPTARLLVIGIGPMEQALKEQAEQLQLGQRVIFLGEIPDAELVNYYAASDIFILPSCERSEAFGIVQLEAMAAGKPVISTELGTGTSYVNLDGETGLVVPPSNPSALAQAINELVTNPERGKKLGAQGQERTRATFSLKKMAEEVEKFYIEVSSGSS
ncbi:MAG: glycosyltransferase [Chloroflexota bacterium]|nr:glycosyltransferase [Chloroflexota bacterium]